MISAAVTDPAIATARVTGERSAAAQARTFTGAAWQSLRASRPSLRHATLRAAAEAEPRERGDRGIAARFHLMLLCGKDC